MAKLANVVYMIGVIHISGYVAVTEINSKNKHQEKTAITVMNTEKTTHKRIQMTQSKHSWSTILLMDIDKYTFSNPGTYRRMHVH